MNTKENISLRDLYAIIAEASLTDLGISSDEFKQAMASQPACRNKIDTKTAEALKKYKQGRYNEALACYDELIGLIQESSNYLRFMADAIKNDQEKAAAQPNNTSKVNLLNTFHETNNSFLEWDAEALATMYTMRGNVKHNLGKLNEAINDYKEGLKHKSVREAAQKNINALQEKLASKEKSAVDKTEYERMKRSKDAADELVQLIKAEKPTYEDIDTSEFDELLDKNKLNEASKPKDNETEHLKAELAKYKALGTPEELKKAVEQAKEGEDLKNRLDAAINATEEHKPTYQKKTPEEIKKMFGLE